MSSRVPAALVAVALALLTAACGDEARGPQPSTLKWFIFNEPSGVLPRIAGECSRLSNGRYEIEFESCRPTPTASASSSFAASVPRTTPSTSSAWT